MFTYRPAHYLRNLACAAVLACLGSAAFAQLPIVSGTAWRATATMPPANWTSIDFNDSAWSHAYAPFPNAGTFPQQIVGGATNAKLMWFWDKPTPPTPYSGPNAVWFRYTFTNEIVRAALPIIAQALVLADDDFELYVNGRKYQFVSPTVLAANFRPNGTPRPLLANLTSSIRNGKNVIAIHATNSGGPKWMLFDGFIKVVDPKLADTPAVAQPGAAEPAQ